LLSFGAANTASFNSPVLSANNLNPVIAGFWDDLNPLTAGDVYYLEQSDRLIVQYEQVWFYTYSGEGMVTFQVVLHADGEIDFFYKTLTMGSITATVGIANTSGTGEGVQISHNQSYVTNGLAVKFSPVPIYNSVESPIANGTASAHSIQRIDLPVQALASMTGGLYNATLNVTFDRANTPMWRVPVTLKIATGNPVMTLAEPIGARLLE
jgi:hypothetical protein